MELNEKQKKHNQIKSKERVRDYGEVYTPQHIVNAMLDLVKHETERIDSRFLEPACGNGNFLAEVLQRKLAVVDSRYSKTQIQWEYNAIIAVSSIYGVDILEDNAEECRKRLFNIFKEHYYAMFADKCKPEVLRSVNFLLHRNILWGDALDFTNPVTKQPIIFSEWSAVNGTMLKRKDYMFKFLVEKSFQTSLFNDEGNPAAIDEPIKDFPLVHFLKLSESEFSEFKDYQDEKI
jgi:SAM-dependent methyltransferase